MANQYGFSLGDVYKDIESIKGQRTTNEFNRLKLDEAKAQPARNVLIQGARQSAATGSAEAQRQLLVIDPEGGPKFLEALSKMDERQVEATKRSVEQIGQQAFHVSQGKTDQEKASRYQTLYESLPPESKSKMPPQYDPNFIDMALSKAQTMDQLLANPQAVKVGGEDVVYKNGQEIERASQPLEAPKSVQLGNQDILYQGDQELERANRPVKAGDAGAPRSFKSGDENLVYKQMVELEGGIMDQDGNVREMSQPAMYRAQARTSEAMKLLQ